MNCRCCQRAAWPVLTPPSLLCVRVRTDPSRARRDSLPQSVDIFAAKVRADPKLAKGFNAFGLSQGNNLIHGYQLKYNDPPVVSFISICGINAGVGAIPQCSPNGSIPIIGPVVGPICEALAEAAGDAANTEVVQDILFQANYYRDPMALSSKDFLSYNELAQWNGEGKPGSFNQTFKENFLKTDANVWVRGRGLAYHSLAMQDAADVSLGRVSWLMCR